MNSESDQHLERELRREASAERPRYLAARHARIMRAVAETSVAASSADRQHDPDKWPRALVWVALAASLLFAAFLVQWHANRQARDEMHLAAVADTRPANPAVPTEDQPVDGIGNAVGMVELALDEISAIGQVELFAQIVDPVTDFPRPFVSTGQAAESTQPTVEVDELTLAQWSDLEGDARLVASLLTGSLPRDLVP